MSYKRKPENITFSVAITPDKKNKLENEDTRSFAVLAPFNPFPKVVFENIKLHCPASREVYLVNPLENTLQVALTKLPDEARGYTWSATEFELAKESQALLVITWTPSEYGSWHDSVKIINKKTKKPLSELKLSSTTEEPPKVHRRCSKSRRAFSKTQNGLSKQENSTKSTLVIKQSENKENVLQQMHLIAKSKELSQSVVCLKNENVTIYESKKSLLQTTVKHEDRQCYRETSETRVSQPLATITSIQDSNPICIAPLTPRRSTYDVTESVVSSRRSTYSLKNKQITSIMEVEKEKREFDLLASPGVHNKSLEVAASKLVDRCVKDRLSCVEEAEPMDGAGPSTTFIIDPSATDSVKAPSNLASLTFNVVEIPPSPVAGPSHELLYDYQPLKCNERFSIDSVASSEIFYDSLEEGQQCRKSLETMLPSGMRWDEFYDFEKFSSETPRVKNGSLKPDHKESAGLSSSSEPLDRNNKVDQPEAPPELVQDTSSNFLSATPYRNITLRRKPSSLSCTISLNTNDGLDGEEILNGSKTLNQTKDTLLQLDEDFGKFNFSIVASSPVYLPSATSKNNLNGTSTPLKSNSVKYSNIEHSPYNNGSYVHQNEYSQNLNDKGTNCCKFYTNRKINNTDLIEPNAEETEKCISVGEFKPYDERKSMSSKEKSPCHETQSENTKSKVPDKTELEEMKHLEQDPLIWNISPPKNNTEEKGTKKQITQCHSSKLAPSKILTKTLRPSRLSNPACKNNFAKVEDNSRTIVGINSAKMPSSSVKNKTPSNPGVSSEDVFLVPSTRVKRGSFAKPSNGSPPKIRKFGDLKIKRLSSTPSMSRKSPFSSMSEARNGSRKECLRSLPRSATLFRKRKSLKVADWVPAARKLKLSSECGSQSEEDISTVAADLDTPDVFVASTTLNPFTEGSCYFSQDWLKEQETELLQWADRMLRPPNELQLDRDQSERGTLHRLNALRAAAFTILTSQPVTDVLRKVKVAVDNNIICIRSDRQLHADLGLQDKIIGLLMSYNPLWLRLCLEAVYQCNIHLKCHSDEAGLRDFIRQYVLDDEYLRKTYSHPTIPYLMMPQFEDKMKKFTVYKFLVLVYLLDLVKIKKVILHDPCLFKKDSRLKSSKEILIDFNKNFVAAAGDITKILRLRGYEVRHQQTYIDEFDFSLTCTKDLRDGVRLTRMVENLVGDNTLCSQLRVPAVSILQKNHNAKVAFTNLKKAGYDLPAEVSPKDISDGHSEKTLSFLWHLRGIFQKRAVMLIIMKWRETKQLREDRKYFLKLRSSAVKIQRWFRKIKKSGSLSKEEEKKGFEARKNFLKLKAVTVQIQRRFRKNKEERILKKKCEAVQIIQNWYKNQKRFLADRNHFKRSKEAAVTIQRAFRHYRAKKSGAKLVERQDFMAKKAAAIAIQRRFREYCLAKHERKQFIAKKEAAITIQKRFREYRLAKHEREQFIVMKDAAITIQRRFREYRLAKHERKQFIAKKEAAITIQRRFREYRQAKHEREQFIAKKEAAINIQRRFREYRLAKHERKQFIAKKEAAITIQRRFREYCLAKHEREQFTVKREAAITIQRRFREYCLAKHEREQFTVKREAAITIQRRFREYRQAKHERRQFIAKKEAAITIQRRYRAWTAMKHARQEFISLKISAIAIQRFYRKYRENQTARFISEESSVARKNSAASRIQAAWRGYLVRKTVKVPQQPKAAPSGVQVATDNHQPILTRGQHYCGILFNSHKCSVAELQNTLFNIDVITVLSADQCQYFVENGAVRILFEILAHQTNRAVCVQTCIELILSILLNFYRAPGAADIAWQETIKANGIFIVFDLMMRFKSEKSPNVFCKACTVVWLLAHDPVKVQVMLKTPKVPQTYQYVVKSLKKPEQGPSSFRRSEHSRLSTRKVAGGAKKKLPALRFNWGQYFDDLRAFDDKNVALDSVVDKLGRFFKV